MKVTDFRAKLNAAFPPETVYAYTPDLVRVAYRSPISNKNIRMVPTGIIYSNKHGPNETEQQAITARLNEIVTFIKSTKVASDITIEQKFLTENTAGFVFKRGNKELFDVYAFRANWAIDKPTIGATSKCDAMQVYFEVFVQRF